MNKIKYVTGKDVTNKYIDQAVELDKKVYENIYQINTDE